MQLASVDEVIAEIRGGRIVVLVDEDAPDSEGYLCAAAEKITPETVNFMLLHGRGLVSVALTEERMKQLEIPLMVQECSSTQGSAFGVSIAHRADASAAASAASRAHTIRAAAAGGARRSDFLTPGSVFPIQTKNGGVLVRSGQVEAAVDLARIAGFQPSGVICQILQEDGAVALAPYLETFAERHRLKTASIAELIAYRLRSECLVKRVTEADFPTIHGGAYKAIVYHNNVDAHEHIALVKNEIRRDDAVLVRMHSECLTGDVFGSERCDCGDQIRQSLKLIDAEGKGVLV